MKKVIEGYSKLTVTETFDNKLRLEKRHPEYVASVIFIGVMTYGVIGNNKSQWLTDHFQLVSAAHTIVFAYAGVAAVLNKTIVEIGQGVVTRKFAPLPVPWPKSVTLNYHEISSVICVKSIGRKNADNISYSIILLTTHGENETLASLIGEKNFAEKVAKRIANKMGKFKWSYTA